MVVEGQKPDAERAHAWGRKEGRKGWRDERRGGRMDGRREGRGVRERPSSRPAIRLVMREHAASSVCARVSSNLNVLERGLNNLFHARNLGLVPQRFALLLRPHLVSLDLVRPVKLDLELALGV